MNRNCIFVGNGLNRCLTNSISWATLMEKVANEIGVEECKGIPMPMEFERLANEYMRKETAAGSDIYLKMKQFICEMLKSVKLPEDAVHYELKKLALDVIMTTNYDYLLEYVYKADYKCAYPQRKYVFDQTSKLGETVFYHPHGIAHAQISLCLGYEHYMGIVENLRRKINTKKDNKKDNMMIKRVLLGEDAPSGEWGELFYTDNIAFVGFELDSCEVDIWWLLTHRAYIYYMDCGNVRSKLRNSIVYYDIIDVGEKKNSAEEGIRKKMEEAKRRKHALLASEHVIVKKYTIKDDEEYVVQYQKILDDIKCNGICS